MFISMFPILIGMFIVYYNKMGAARSTQHFVEVYTKVTSHAWIGCRVIHMVNESTF